MKWTLHAVSALVLCCIALAAWAGDEEDVAAAMTDWQSRLAAASPEDPSGVVGLYAEDAVLWGTISTERRDTPAAIKDYFVNALTKLPRLSVVFEKPLIRIYGDTAINTGYYTFSYVKDGATATLPARYSFTYVKHDGKWMIADHHSSAMPK